MERSPLGMGPSGKLRAVRTMYFATSCSRAKSGLLIPASQGSDDGLRIKSRNSKDSAVKLAKVRETPRRKVVNEYRRLVVAPTTKFRENKRALLFFEVPNRPVRVASESTARRRLNTAYKVDGGRTFKAKVNEQSITGLFREMSERFFCGVRGVDRVVGQEGAGELLVLRTVFDD